MIAFIIAHWAEILLTIVTTGALGLCGLVLKELKGYRNYKSEKEDQKTEEMVEDKIAPIVEEIEELREHIRKTARTEETHMKLIISSYKFRLVQLCKIFIRQGFMTQDQYDQLSEFYKVYTGLGGNGQAKEYYDRAILLPIKEVE